MLVLNRRRQFFKKITCTGNIAAIPDPFFRQALYELAQAQINGSMRYPDPQVQDCELQQITAIPDNWQDIDETNRNRHNYSAVDGSGTHAILDITGLNQLINLRYIGDNAFNRYLAYYSSQHRINLLAAGFHLGPASRHIGEQAFYGNTLVPGKIETLQNLEFLGKRAFALCYCLYGSLIFSNSMEVIEEAVFYEAGKNNNAWPDDPAKKGFDQLILPDNVKSIKNNAFAYCNIYGTLDLKNVEQIGDGAFSYCKFTGDLVLPDSFRDTALSDDYPDYVNQEIFKGTAMGGSLALSAHPQFTTIGRAMFAGCQLTGALVIPPNVKHLWYECFYNNRFAGQLTVPAQIESFEMQNGGDSYHFSYNHFTSAVILAALQKLPPHFLSYNSLLQTVVIQPSYTEIKYNAFLNCNQLQSVTGCQNVAIIDNQAFQSCGSLNDLDMPVLQSVGAYAFQSAKIPQNFCNSALPHVSAIQASAFYNANFDNNGGLIQFSGLQQLGNNAFLNSQNLKQAKFPCLASIEPNTQTACPTYYQSQPVWSGLFGNSQIETVDFSGSTFQELPRWAFANCQNLQSVILPNTLVKINRGAFKNCNVLSNLVIPPSVQYIEEQGSDNTITANSLTFNLTNLLTPYLIIRSGNGFYSTLHINASGTTPCMINCQNASSIPPAEFNQLLATFNQPPQPGYEQNIFRQQTLDDYAAAYPAQTNLNAAIALGWSFYFI